MAFQVPRQSDGFTILELLVVTGVLAVLFGLGVGFLGQTDPEQVAAAVIAGETRNAQVTARAEGLPTEVLVTPGVDGMPATVQARLLEPVASWRFEPGEGVADPDLRPFLGGQDEPRGRFGHGRRPGGDGRAPVLRWTVPRPAEFAEGFAVRLDLRLEQRQAGSVLRLGSALDLQLDAEARLQARFRVRGAGGASQGAQVQSQQPVPLRTWCTVDAVCDGRRVWLVQDGQELGHALVDGGPLLEPGEALDVLPADAALPAIVDEVRMFAQVFAPPQYLPTELVPTRTFRFAYDAQGTVVANPQLQWLVPEEGR